MLLNTAEGNGRRQGRQRAKFFDDARGSAIECAACLDASVAKGFVVLQRKGFAKSGRARVIQERRAFFGCRMNTLAIAYFRGSQRLVLTKTLALSPKTKAFGRSIFAHKIAKISKGSGTDFVATRLYRAGMLASGL